MSAVASDMQVAADYQTYTQNTELINLLMAFNPDSTFATGWQLTLLRAQELGLNRVHEETGWTATLDPGTSIAAGWSRGGVLGSAFSFVSPELFGAIGGAPDAGYRFHETVRDNNGILVEDIYFNDDGTETTYNYYMDQSITLDHGAVHVVAGATYAITGSDDTITAGSRSNVSVVGDRDSITVNGIGATIEVTGANETLAMRRGLAYLTAGSSLAVSGADDAITGEDGVTLSLSGTGYQVALTDSTIALGD